MTIRILSIFLFGCGVSVIVFYTIAKMNFSRTAALSYAHLLNVGPRVSKLYEAWKRSEEHSKSGIKLRGKLQIAGNPFGLTVMSYNMTKLGLFIAVTLLYIIDFIIKFQKTHDLFSFPIIQYGLVFFVVWLLPDVLISLRGKSRKAALMREISKLSHRMTMCITDKTDLRETIIRAGRTMHVLRPYINELITNWNTGQEAAIITFGERVGITEVYPLVNTLLAVSNVDASEISSMLEQQVESIDKTLDFEIQRKIENAPLGIIFLIAVPFFVVIILMIYPWMSYLTEQLKGSFTSGGVAP